MGHLQPSFVPTELMAGVQGRFLRAGDQQSADLWHLVLEEEAVKRLTEQL
jgi:hypothetical protein